ncbi:MAG TPA: hypothetical protein VFF06_20265 [Polyangia bacterium]|nr:hypothetical protein [Polyangia bacterium]
MRVTLLGVLLAACGCASLANHLTHVGTAVGLGLTAATVAVFGGPIGGSPVVSASVAPAPVAGGEAEVTIVSDTAAPPAPAQAYQTWIVARTACANAREYHVRCVRTQQQACFFETDDGFAYDCADAECKTVPPELGAWCAGGAQQ